MGGVTRLSGVIAGLLMLPLLAAAEARADDTHYRGVPIGAHAIGLGGAFAGVADDASAAYFNPAGLALSGAVGIAAGLTINAWQREEIERALEQVDGVTNATTKSNRTVPIFVGAALKFGPKDRYDNRRYTLGLSIVEPIFGTRGVFVKFTGDPIELTDTYDINESDRATWYGLSFAGRIKRKHLLGTSLYLSVRKLNHSETGLTLAGGTQVDVPGQDGAVFEGTSTAANRQSLSFKAFHFVLRLGWLARLKPQLQIGVMASLPGIPLKQSVSTFSQGFLNDNPDPSAPALTEASFIDQTVGANLPLPAEIEVGFEYWPAERVMLAIDASAHFPVKEGSRIESAAASEVDGLFFDNSTQRRATGNVAIAGDFFIGKVVMIETGFFTDFSSAPKIPEDPTRFYNPRVNRFGGTLSVGFNVFGISLAVGSTVIFGKGNATGVVADLDNFVADYTRTQAKQRIVYLHITGATRAVEDATSKSMEAVKERRRRQAEEEEEEEERARREAEEAQKDATDEEAGEEPVPSGGE